MFLCRNKKNIHSFQLKKKIFSGAMFYRSYLKHMLLDTLGKFSVIFNKGDNFCDIMLAFLYPNPLLKVVNSKRREFTPKGSKLFFFRVDPFQKGGQNNFDSDTSPEIVPISLKQFNLMMYL